MHCLKPSAGHPAGDLPEVNFSNTIDGLMVVLLDNETSFCLCETKVGAVLKSSCGKALLNRSC